ncbi:MAG TPA: hypothetical protein VGS07_18615 [Thermoanaerobaculia bacterium]|jgi:hypothetical protein|nr:hypothetical protein [Thermoanaerobaculia bacterium]
MKKRQKPLSLDRETLRVLVVGGIARPAYGPTFDCPQTMYDSERCMTD